MRHLFDIEGSVSHRLKKCVGMGGRTEILDADLRKRKARAVLSQTGLMREDY